MIREARRRELLKRQTVIKRLETQLSEQRRLMREELRSAQKEGASNGELGNLLGVSRQRIQQLRETP